MEKEETVLEKSKAQKTQPIKISAMQQQVMTPGVQQTIGDASKLENSPAINE